MNSLTFGNGYRRLVAIDLQNVYRFCKLNYLAFKQYFEKQGGIVSFHAYTAYDPNSDRQRRFLSSLAFHGYRVIDRPIRRLSDGSIEGNLDVLIALDVFQASHEYDEVILVSGDGDYVHLIDLLSSMGKRTVVIGPVGGTSFELIKSCHVFIPLQSINGICLGDDDSMLDNEDVESAD